MVRMEDTGAIRRGLAQTGPIAIRPASGRTEPSGDMGERSDQTAPSVTPAMRALPAIGHGTGEAGITVMHPPGGTAAGITFGIVIPSRWHSEPRCGGSPQ